MSDDLALLADSADRLLQDGAEDLNAAIAELGWLMLPFAEADGGLASEDGDAGLLTLFDYFGRHAHVPQLMSQAVFGGTIVAEAKNWRRRNSTIAALMAGDARIACALHEPDHRPGDGRPDVALTRTTSGWRLSGTKTLVIGARAATLIVVSAHVEGTDALAMIALDAGDAGPHLRPYTLRDGQDAADLVVDGLALPSDALMLSGADAESALAVALARHRRCLAAEAAGLVRHATSRTQGYAADRSQFGQPIAQFQAVQHRLADMAAADAQARALLATIMADPDGGSGETACASLFALALATAKSAIQVHGGIGMTEDLPLGQILRRSLTHIALA